MIRISPKRKTSSEMDMTPLIDVVFTLLLFFVLAAAFTIHGMDVDLPTANATKAISGRVVEVRLNADATFEIDKVKVDRADVPYKLNAVVKGFRERPGQLVLLADPKAPVDALIYLVDHVRRNGGEKLMVATQAPGEGK